MIAEVARRTGLEDPAEVRPTMAATTRALGFVMSRGEAENAASQLPGEVAGSLMSEPGIHPDWTDEEFVAYVAERAEVDGPAARARISEVMAVLREALTPGEFTDALIDVDSSITDLAA